VKLGEALAARVELAAQTVLAVLLGCVTTALEHARVERPVNHVDITTPTTSTSDRPPHLHSYARSMSSGMQVRLWTHALAQLAVAPLHVALVDGVQLEPVGAEGRASVPAFAVGPRDEVVERVGLEPTTADTLALRVAPLQEASERPAPAPGLLNLGEEEGTAWS
jgi:hypothetical protein